MKSVQTTGLVVAILIAAAAAGFGVYQWMQPNRNAQLAQEQATPEQAPAMTPQQAMSVSMNDLDGAPHTLADWHGKVMLVNFWATWCPPCREEIPLLVKLQAKYAARGLQIVGIATDETSEDSVRTFTRRMLVNYPILMGNEQVEQMVAGLGGDLIGLPYTVLVNRQGQVIRLHPGQLHPGETEKWISEALDGTTPAPAAASTPPRNQTATK